MRLARRLWVWLLVVTARAADHLLGTTPEFVIDLEDCIKAHARRLAETVMHAPGSEVLSPVTPPPVCGPLSAVPSVGQQVRRRYGQGRLPSGPLRGLMIDIEPLPLDIESLHTLYLGRRP